MKHHAMRLSPPVNRWVAGSSPARGANCLKNLRKLAPYQMLLRIRHGYGEAFPMTSRRFPLPWRIEQTPGGFKVLDANAVTRLHLLSRDG